MRLRILSLALALAVLLPGVARAQNREHLQMSADLRMLQEQVGRLQLAVNQLRDWATDTDTRIEQLGSSNVKGFADQKVIIDQVVSTLATMREKLDDNTTRVSQLTQEFSAIREGLRMLTDQVNALVLILRPPPETDDSGASTTPPALPPVANNAPPAGTPAAPAAAPPPLEAVTMPASPAAYLTDAMNNYYSGRYDIAIDAFADVIQKFPGTPQAATAQFHLAESYYQQHKCAEALPEYQKVTTEYPTSQHVPDAYLMQGVCYLDLDQAANARKMFDQVMKLYPESTQAIQAEQLLRRN